MEKAYAVAKKLLRYSPEALKAAKMALNSALGCDVQTGLQIESNAWCSLFGMSGQKEGMEAFLNKGKKRQGE
jgi:1,4-dihydroxy-2-naphthoyl-CoA synthase